MFDLYCDLARVRHNLEAAQARLDAALKRDGCAGQSMDFWQALEDVDGLQAEADEICDEINRLEGNEQG